MSEVLPAAHSQLRLFLAAPGAGTGSRQRKVRRGCAWELSYFLVPSVLALRGHTDTQRVADEAAWGEVASCLRKNASSFAKCCWLRLRESRSSPSYRSREAVEGLWAEIPCN